MVWVDTFEDGLKEIWKGIQTKSMTLDFLEAEHQQIRSEHPITENNEMTMNSIV